MSDTDVSIATATGSTRGCDLWARESRHIIWELAYGGEYADEKPIIAFGKARWRLWRELDAASKKAWNLKGEVARERVKGNLQSVPDPKISFRYARPIAHAGGADSARSTKSISLRHRVEAFTAELWAELGVAVVLTYGTWTDRGLIIGVYVWSCMLTESLTTTWQ